MDIFNKKIELTKSMLIALILIIGISSCKKDDDDDPNKTTPTTTSGFCYSLTTSNSAYDTIVGGTEVANLNSDNFYEIDLGFSFSFCDSTFQTMYIMDEAYVPVLSYVVNQGYTDASKYELLPFGSINIESGNSSKLLYKTTGTAGDRITTIEWRDFTYTEPFTSVNSTFNFQLKLYENGNKVEYHYGANDITTDFTAVDLSFLAVGLYSVDSNDGLFLSGNSSSPNTASATGTNELSAWPTEGTKYLFQ